MVYLPNERRPLSYGITAVFLFGIFTERDEAVKLWDNGRFSFLLYSEPDEAVKSWDNGRFWFGVVMVTIPNEETASKSMFYTEQDTGLIRHYQNTRIIPDVVNRTFGNRTQSNPIVRLGSIGFGNRT